MLIVNPIPMQWEHRYREIFPEAKWSDKPELGHDTYIFMWCDQSTIDFINNNEKQGRYIVFVRRYEMFSFDMKRVHWGKVDEVIMVNDYLASVFCDLTGKLPKVIYNGVDPSMWTFKEREHGKKIAWVGYINQKKNIPLALQILKSLPEDYELHMAGANQDPQTTMYIDNIAQSTGIKVFWYGRINPKDIDKWLDDKNYILSTAISEGCPNNVIEAMAKGIKPIIHDWPGAKEQFGEYVFATIDKAVEQITGGEYDSNKYRELVRGKFGLDNYEKVKEITCAVSLLV